MPQGTLPRPGEPEGAPAQSGRDGWKQPNDRVELRIEGGLHLSASSGALPPYHGRDSTAWQTNIHRLSEQSEVFNKPLICLLYFRFFRAIN